ncbi:MAG: TlpA disulfide reductase family protein [Candidatus Limnocylindrales bacterium]
MTTSNSRDSRREAARSRDRATGGNRWLLPAIGAAIVIVAAIGAIALSGGSPDGGSSARPSTSGSAAASVAPGGEPVISGAALAPFQGPTGDAAVGRPIPTVTAASGSIAPDGRPKVLLFLAHWCNHCQNEVPVVQAWLDGGGLPAAVDLVSISTGIDASRPNYPPEDWLARESWTPPVITDPTNAVADAFGLTAFPYWVLVGSDGTVQGRLTGELSIADLESVIASLRR